MFNGLTLNFGIFDFKTIVSFFVFMLFNIQSKDNNINFSISIEEKEANPHAHSILF